MPIKLLIITPYESSFYNAEKSGYIDRLINYYNLFSKKKIETNIISYGDNKELNYTQVLQVNKIIPVAKYIKSNHSFLKFLKSFLLPLKLKKYFKNADIIRINQLTGCWVASIAKLLYNKKLFVRCGYEWLRNYIDRFKIQKKKNYLKFIWNYFKIFFFEYITYKLADIIVLSSDSDIDFIEKRFNLKRRKEKIVHIYNWINTDQFKPLDVAKIDKNVLFIGILYPAKNIFNLIKAFTDLDGFKLDIIGRGPYEQLYQKITKDLNLEINFLGIISNYKLPEIYNQHQIFILPSFYEGNPKVLLEAMSCGVACIGTNVRGINNIIKHRENGYLCGTNSESIRNAILKLYNDAKLRKIIGQNARQFVLNNCSTEYVVNKEYKLYFSLFK